VRNNTNLRNIKVHDLHVIAGCVINCINYSLC